ncbi:hypothetical protein [Roseateles saccharophilus]|uniref:Uncharacterized protein n=1 Tax=Roseateles saccharophilus TaxID=304 RepID=A0A4R3V7G5_ROSSA|nr:hypothetical protein [Roseateles saccharophilus]MDG0831574.1 hypothetical protein [Roseateles saccharophilus]TCV01016.1 hypothetical protein EV671_1007145 [Roseateles saccharophilus]
MQIHILRRPLAAGLLAALAFTSAPAAPLTPAELPAAARDWLPWALQGQPPLGCPAPHDAAEPAVCVWPGRLQLSVGARDAGFRLEMQVFGAPARVALPGEAGAWPQDVKAGGKALAVAESGGHPAVWLPPGAHVVEGRIAWGAKEMPQNLAVPAGLGAIVVTSDGATQSRAPDAEGRLWLRAVAGPAEASDSLDLKTVRLVDDDLPLGVTSAFELRVAGRARAVELPRALLPGFVAMQLDSPLPARLAENGRLVVQARPGAWHIELQARLTAPVQALKLPQGEGGEEVWVVKAEPALRLIRPEGPASVDPRQIEMPEAWRALPAFRLKPGDTLKLTELQRGNARPAPDALKLTRRLWLDFDGGGLTANDHFSGQLSASSRLTMAAPGLLGRAALAGQDQPITRLAPDGPAGFEVRRSGDGIAADSRWPRGTLPASGWSVPVDQLEATLQLPPGWRLLHAQGPSRADGAWVSMWTLWDFFFVLLAALAAYRLLGWRVGLLLGVALALTWHTPGSPPAALWFGLLALTALARVLPAGRMQTGFARGRLAVAVLIGLVLLPYAVQEVRQAIYPSLERGGMAMAEEPVAAPAAVVLQQKRMASELRRSAPAAPLVPPPKFSVPSSSDMDRVDPTARVQTGPGLPAWQWRGHHLSWSGPVTPAQTLKLWLLPPWATALLKLLGLALLALALAAVAGWPLPRFPRLPRGGAGAALALLAALGLAPTPGDAATPTPIKAEDMGAAWPSDAQLQALRGKLATPPDCLPRCAELARLLVSAQGPAVQLRAEVHAQALVAVPLPGQGKGWQPSSVLLDGQPAATRRDDQGRLWAAVPAGVHQLVLAADVGDASGLDIALPLPPRELQTELRGWTLAGLDPRGQSSGALTLSREAATAGGARAEDAGTQRDALPPLVRVQRRLELGLRWQVQTHIERAAPSRAPLRVRWALLPGEAVGDARVTVEGGMASLQLGAEDEADVASSLQPGAALTLAAGHEPNQVEQWTLAASTQWHAEASGLPPTALQQGGEWLPEWRPWPGETLKLAVKKPAGVDGQTLTLDGVQTRIEPGERSSDVALELKLRASLGGPHTLKLPAGAELLGVKINGEPLALQLRDGALTLPLTPGAQAAEIRWRVPEGMGAGWRHAGLALGLGGVNDSLTLAVPEDRIVLAVGGPLIGPAVLIWGALAVALLLAWWAPRGVPGLMGRPAWVLLVLGVAPVSLWALGVLAGWFGALEARRRWAGQGSRGLRIAVQLGLVLLTLCAVGALLDVLRTGLLGYPDLLVAGPDSSSHLLSWMGDRFTEHTAGAWVLSAPLWLYRAAMLAWALWLAASLLRWVGWAWAAFSAGEAWPGRAVVIESRPEAPPPADPA